MRRRITATLILTIVSLVVATIIAAGNVVTANFDNASIYPLTITLTGGPQDLNIVLGNTSTTPVHGNGITDVAVGDSADATTQSINNPEDLSMLSGPTVTNTLTLSGEPTGFDDTFGGNIITNTTTLPNGDLVDSSAISSLTTGTTSAAGSTHNDKFAAPCKDIDAPAPTIESESIADDPALADEFLKDLESTEEYLTNEILEDPELSGDTGILSDEKTSEATSIPADDVAGTTIISEETNMLTAYTSAEFTTIDIATETTLVTGTEEIAIPGNSLSDFLLENGLLAAMIFVSGIAAVLFVVCVIVARKH
jgi:hypothetical protein